MVCQAFHGTVRHDHAALRSSTQWQSVTHGPCHGVAYLSQSDAPPRIMVSPDADTRS